MSIITHGWEEKQHQEVKILVSYIHSCDRMLEIKWKQNTGPITCLVYLYGSKMMFSLNDHCDVLVAIGTLFKKISK